MAVGLSKRELNSTQNQIDFFGSHIGLALPSNNSRIIIDYPGKLPESEILLNSTDSVYHLLKSPTNITTNISANSFVWSDNFSTLHTLLQQNTKVQLFYLDPPYATGMDFQSRDLQHAYDDSMSDTVYLEFMRRRLILMRELLEETGSIYVHIGHQMVAELKIIMDEIFGKNNFRNLITRRKCSSKNFTKNQYPNLNDYILFYTKSNNYIWNQPSQKALPEWIAKEYTKVDERGPYKLVPVHAPGTRRGETGGLWRGKLPPAGKHWQYTPEKLDAMDANGEMYWSKNGNPRRKVYLPDDKKIPLTDYWSDYKDAHHQSILITGYPTEKNFDMLKMIVGASSNEGDLVVDPFCGSGTTIHAADELKRKWIGIDRSSLSAKTVLTRMTVGRKPMGDFVNQPNPDSTHEQIESEFDFLVADEIFQKYQPDIDELKKLI